MASLVFNRAKKEIADGTIDLLSDTLKIMLVDSGYSPDADDEFVNDGAAANELSGTGYASGFAGAGRKTIGNKSIAADDANDRAEFDSTDDQTWSSIDAGTAAAMVLYKHNTSDADSVVIAYIDTGGFPVVTNGGDLTIQWNAEGILQFT